MRIDNKPPPNGALTCAVLMVILRWQWIAAVRRNFVTATLALVDARVRSGFTWLVNAVERRVIGGAEILLIFVKRHDLSPFVV